MCKYAQVCTSMCKYQLVRTQILITESTSQYRVTFDEGRNVISDARLYLHNDMHVD